MEEKYLRIASPSFKGKAEGELDVLEIDKEHGVKCLYSREKDRVKTYLFDNTLWTKGEAQEFVNGRHSDDASMEVVAHIEKTEKGMLAVASDDVIDRDGESISVSGWDLKNYKRNPVLLWAHNRRNTDGRPIGIAKNIQIKKINGSKKLIFEPVFDDSTEFNRETASMADKGLLNTFSVGFLVKDRDEEMASKITKQELLEISLVPIPANANAEFISRAKEMGISKGTVKQFIEMKSVVAFRAYEPAPETRAWDSNAADGKTRVFAGGPDKDDVDFDKYKEAFTWYDATEAESFKSYKLPHHDVQGDKLITVWRGVAAAMAALLGARGGVDIPDEDRRKVYNHLVKHYTQFDKTPPDFKSVETGELKELFDLESELLEKKNFKEFKGNLRAVKHMIKEIKKEKKLDREEAKKLKESAKVRALMSLYKALPDTLKESQKKGGIK